MSMTATACVTESCTSKGQVQCFGWHQGSRGTEWGQELWGGERTPHPTPTMGSGLGEAEQRPPQQPSAPREGGRAYAWRRNHHPFSLTMAALVECQPQPSPAPGLVVSLGSITSRLGDLHKPLASAFLSVSGEGLNHIR